MNYKNCILRILLFILFLFCFSSCTKKLNPEDDFKKYVMDPIPKSVKNIKVDQTMDVGGYGYIFGFDIERKDLNLIIDSKSLKQIPESEYTQGFLILKYHQEELDSMYIPINEHSKGVSWFRPELWRNPDTYCYIKSNHQNDIRILLFNNEENKAYFYIERSRN